MIEIYFGYNPLLKLGKVIYKSVLKVELKVFQ